MKSIGKDSKSLFAILSRSPAILRVLSKLLETVGGGGREDSFMILYNFEETLKELI